MRAHDEAGSSIDGPLGRAHRHGTVPAPTNASRSLATAANASMARSASASGSLSVSSHDVNTSRHEGLADAWRLGRGNVASDRDDSALADQIRNRWSVGH